MKYQMVGADWCEKCQQAKKILQDRELWGWIEYIDYEDPRAKELAKTHEAELIPFFIYDGRFIGTVGQLLHELERRKAGNRQ